MLDDVLQHSSATGKSTGCLVVTIDDMQGVIDRHGLAAHDQLVRNLADRLVLLLREGDVVARLSGDRFAIALGPTRRMDIETLIQIATRAQSALQEPFPVGRLPVYVTCSVGFCLPARAPDQTGAAMLAAAELATEDARRHGPSAIRSYGPDLAAAARLRNGLFDQIEAALETGQMIAHFQPQLSTDTGLVSGIEALARWKHPERGILPPAEFLPSLAAAGLSARLGEVMVHHCLDALRAWDRSGCKVPRVAVNLSSAELRDPTLVGRLRWELDRFDLAPDRLTVEVLESVVAETDNDTVVRTVAGLSALGCGIDLDDFGTGHASITSIRRFDVGRIKIDRSFVTRVDSDPAQQRMVAAILSMAEQLGLGTVAEGVETAAEHAMLAQLGCGHVQGYAIARPMPFEETIAWLSRHADKVARAATPARKSV